MPVDFFLQDPADPYLKDYDEEVVLMIYDQSNNTAAAGLEALRTVRFHPIHPHYHALLGVPLFLPLSLVSFRPSVRARDLFC